MRLLGVLGASEALGDHLVRHPEHWRELTDPSLGSTRPAAYAVRCGLLACGRRRPATTRPRPPRCPTPRRSTRCGWSTAACCCGWPPATSPTTSRVDDAAAELADLAAGTLDAALAVARQRVGAPAATARLAVVAMGKCGGHELNYVSDVDVIFVAEAVPGADEAAALRAATQLASHAGADLRRPHRRGHDLAGRRGAAARGEGRPAGADAGEPSRLLRALGEDVGVPGAAEGPGRRGRPGRSGSEFVDLVAPMVWSVAERDGFVGDVQAMRRRVLDHIPAREAERQLKLGSGGLRDVEFAVQLLQLVHGRADERLRQGATLSALAELTRGGYVGREDGNAHARRLRLPAHPRAPDPALPAPAHPRGARRRGRPAPAGPVDGLPQGPGRVARTGTGRTTGARCAGCTRSSSTGRCWPPSPGSPAWRHGCRPEAAEARLAALGYADPKAALRHLEALTAGVTRTSTIQRTLLPVLLEWFADAPDPDAGLFGFRRVCEALGRTPWYLRMLRDEGKVAERLARLLATSRYATDLLQREPQGVRLLGEDLQPLGAEAITAEMLATAARQDDAEAAVRSIRAVRRRELFRIAAGDLHDLVDVADVGIGPVPAHRRHAGGDPRRREPVRGGRSAGSTPPPSRLAVVAMGRYGGFELSYGSDADVMFVHEPIEGADPHDGVVVRPRGGQRAASPPRRARRGPRAGGGRGPAARGQAGAAGAHPRLVRRLLRQVVAGLGVPGAAARRRRRRRPRRARAVHRADRPAALPRPTGITEADLVEVRRIKARVDTERLPRGADPHTHLKLGRGGLADVEWTVQAAADEVRRPATPSCARRAPWRRSTRRAPST